MRPPVIYIAGPDIFKLNAAEVYRSYADLCTELGAECLYPNDDIIEPAETREEFARNIFRANINMIARSDIVIANLEPFRGPSLDVGAAFEIGHARAMGKPIIGFTAGPLPTYFERLKEFYGPVEKGDIGYRSVSDGMLLEDFGLSENLMIAHALEGSKVHESFESALKEALSIYNEKEQQAVAYEMPEIEYPKWLESFHSWNDQHERSLGMLEHFLEHLRGDIPRDWRTSSHIGVLDLGCGDGRFSRQIVDMLQRKLGRPVKFVAVDINPAFVEQAQELFPEGRISQGNIFEDHISQFIPPGFDCDIVLMSHALYFATDKCALAERLAALGNPDTLTLYLLNDPIYRQIPKDVDALIGALEQAELPYTQSAPFTSHVQMPERASDYIAHLFAAPDAHYPDEGFQITRRLLFFFQQSPLTSLAPAVRFEFLRNVLNDLRKHGGKIPVRNHWVAVLRKDSRHPFRQAVKAAMLHMSSAPIKR